MINNKNIPLFKVFMSDEAIKSSSEVLSSGYVTQGPIVDKFEKLLMSYFSNEQVVTTNSATSGLHLIIHMLKEYGLGDQKVKIEDTEDHILTTPLTCTATNWPILSNNVNLRWVDVDKTNCNISLDDLEKKLNKNTKAVMVVHWGGYPVDLVRLKQIQVNFEKKYGFKFVIIEDCAHGFGSKLNKKLLGNHGNISVFSFQAIKHMTSVDGGCVIFNSSQDYERAKLLRWYGIDRNENRKDFRCEEDIKEIGFKFHMNDVNASIGIENFHHVTNEKLEINIENGRYYNDKLKNVPGVQVMDYTMQSEVPFWIYTIKVKNRDRFMRHMQEKNIATSRVHERNDIHTVVQKYLTKLPELDSFVDEMICIPVGWWVTKQDREYIVNTIKEGW
jgi:dTDP-4-amino-4,6-dideoxy-D-glucose/dTDP-4-amino-2,4-dideoxy-beta-L-xylose transaminase